MTAQYDAEAVRRFADQLAKGVVITDKGQRDIAAQLRAASERIEQLERALEKAADTFADFRIQYRMTGRLPMEAAARIAEQSTRAALAGEAGT